MRDYANYAKNNMTSHELQRYAELKNIIREATEELDTIKGTIEQMVEEEGGKLEHDAGVFTVQTRTTFVYPEDVNEKAKSIYLEAQREGKYTVKETNTLYFRPTEE